MDPNLALRCNLPSNLGKTTWGIPLPALNYGRFASAETCMTLKSPSTNIHFCCTAYSDPIDVLPNRTTIIENTLSIPQVTPIGVTGKNLALQHNKMDTLPSRRKAHGSWGEIVEATWNARQNALIKRSRASPTQERISSTNVICFFMNFLIFVVQHTASN